MSQQSLQEFLCGGCLTSFGSPEARRFAGTHFPHGVFIDSVAYDKQAAELWKDKFLLFSDTSLIYEIITSKKQQIFISKKVSVEYTAFVTANMTLHIFFCHENMEVKHHDIYLK